jgi:hypothetical protein
MTNWEIAGQSALAVVFAVACASKVARRDAWTAFLHTLPSFGVPRHWPLKALAVAVVVLEGATAGLCALGLRSGALLAVVLLLPFTAGLGFALRANESVACRCFGVSHEPVGKGHLLRNAVLIALAAATSAAPNAARGELSAQVFSASIGVVMGILVTRWEELTYLLLGASPPRPHAGGVGEELP